MLHASVAHSGWGMRQAVSRELDGTKLWWERSPAARTLTRAQRVARNGSALQCTGAGRPGETHCCCRLFSQGRLPPHPNQLKLSLFEVARFGVPCYKASPSCELLVESPSSHSGKAYSHTTAPTVHGD